MAVKAHTVARPVAVGVAAFAAFLWAFGIQRLAANLSAAPRAFALALAGAVLVFGLTRATGVAGGSDSYGYLSQAELWRSGLPIVPQPWSLAPPWPNADRTFIPLGYAPGTVPGIMVPSYAAGFPLLLASATAIGGHTAMFWIVPIAGALLVLLAFAAGRLLGSDAAGLAGAWLVATNPTLLGEVTAPMSDIVAASALAGSCWLILGTGRRRAVAGGLASALAVLVRPNLAPTVCLMTLWVAARRGPDGYRDLGRAAIFALAAAPGFLVTAWINWRFYGSPLVSGYGALSSIYHWQNMLPNLERYVALIVASHAPLALLGFAAIVLAAAGLPSGSGDRSIHAGIALFVFSLVLQYLAYEAATGGGYLRFLLPCWPFVMTAAAALLFAAATSRPARAFVALALIVAGGYGPYRLSREGGMQDWRGERRYPIVAAHVRELTGPSSVVFADQHSGSLRYYGGRMTLRYDLMDPTWLDRSIAWLAAHGAHSYALLDDDEVKRFRQRFAGQERVSALDYPIFVYRGTMIVHFYDLLRNAADTTPPEFVVDRFDNRRFPSPVPPAPFAFAR
jgi:hypothetical protein